MINKSYTENEQFENSYFSTMPEDSIPMMDSIKQDICENLVGTYYHDLCQKLNSIKNQIKTVEKIIKINSSTCGIENIEYKEDNIDMENKDKSCEKCSDKINELSNQYKILDNNISNTNKIIAIIGGFIGVILTVFVFSSTAQYNAIRDISNSNMQSIQTEITSINKRLDYQEELNKLNIENEVRKQIKK